MEQLREVLVALTGGTIKYKYFRELFLSHVPFGNARDCSNSGFAKDFEEVHHTPLTSTVTLVSAGHQQ